MDRLVIWMLPKVARLALIAVYYFLRLTIAVCHITSLVLVACTDSRGYLEDLYDVTTNRTRTVTTTAVRISRAIVNAPSTFCTLSNSMVMRSVDYLNNITHAFGMSRQ